MFQTANDGFSGHSNASLLHSRDAAIKAAILRLHSIAESVPAGTEALKKLINGNVDANYLSKTNPSWVPWF